MGNPYSGSLAAPGKPLDTDPRYFGSCLRPLNPTTNRSAEDSKHGRAKTPGKARLGLTCWLMRRIAMSGLSVNS